MITCCIFDLDGVIVDTAKYHFLAWSRLAKELDIEFTETDNERLKGVSRVESLKIILSLGNKTLEKSDFEQCLVKKNVWYLDYISTLERSEILPGVEEFIAKQKQRGIKIALGSASKNAVLILEKLNLLESFDVVIDGAKVSKAKPDPEVFLLAAKSLDANPTDCVVFEDAAAGIQAALNANMYVVGIGSDESLTSAHVVVPNLKDRSLEELTSVAA